MENKNLLYFSIIPAVIYSILNHKEDEIPKQYTKYDGIKKFFYILMNLSFGVPQIAHLLSTFAAS